MEQVWKKISLKVFDASCIVFCIALSYEGGKQFLISYFLATKQPA